MKKIIFTCITFIIVIFAAIGASNAANIGVSGGKVSSYAGETISITYTTTGVSSNNSLGALEAEVGELPSGITLTKLTSSIGTVSGNMVSYFATGTTGHTSNITITLTLKLDSSISPGDYTIPLKFNALMDYDANDYAKTVNGTVTVKEKQTGNNTNTNNSGGNNAGETITPVIKSSDASLKSITAQADNRDLTLSRNSTKYSATVEADVSKVTFTVIANSSKASIDSNVSTSGVKLSLNSASTAKKVYTVSDLKEGGNSVVRIAIYAEDGTKKDYSFVITRKVAEEQNEVTIPNIVTEEPEQNQEEPKSSEEPKDEGFGLKSLVVTGAEISPQFDTNIYEYTATVHESDSVEIIALPTIEEAIVEIAGNTNLVDGENLVTILVKNGEDIKTYQIILTKEENKTATTVSDSLINSGNGLNFKHIAIIAIGVIIAILIIIRLASMSKKTIEEEIVEEKPSKKGRRYK